MCLTEATNYSAICRIDADMAHQKWLHHDKEAESNCFPSLCIQLKKKYFPIQKWPSSSDFVFMAEGKKLHELQKIVTHSLTSIWWQSNITMLTNMERVPNRKIPNPAESFVGLASNILSFSDLCGTSSKVPFSYNLV